MQIFTIAVILQPYLHLFPIISIVYLLYLNTLRQHFQRATKRNCLALYDVYKNKTLNDYMILLEITSIHTKDNCFINNIQQIL